MKTTGWSAPHALTPPVRNLQRLRPSRLLQLRLSHVRKIITTGACGTKSHTVFNAQLAPKVRDARIVFQTHMVIPVTVRIHARKENFMQRRKHAYTAQSGSGSRCMVRRAVFFAQQEPSNHRQELIPATSAPSTPSKISRANLAVKSVPTVPRVTLGSQKAQGRPRKNNVCAPNASPAHSARQAIYSASSVTPASFKLQLEHPSAQVVLWANFKRLQPQLHASNVAKA